MNNTNIILRYFLYLLTSFSVSITPAYAENIFLDCKGKYRPLFLNLNNGEIYIFDETKGGYYADDGQKCSKTDSEYFCKSPPYGYGGRKSLVSEKTLNRYTGSYIDRTFNTWSGQYMLRDDPGYKCVSGNDRSVKEKMF